MGNEGEKRKKIGSEAMDGSDSLTESGTESRASSSSRRSSSEFSTDDGKDKKGSCSPTTFGWPIRKVELTKSPASNIRGEKSMDLPSEISEIDLMKERFAKLLLGEDMSGSGKGVCTAFAISNAITNLCATIFGQIRRLEPIPSQKKSMWRREMDWILCISDHIVELIPSWQTFPDGSKLEVMTCRPRSDLFMNLPALRKLDNMLLEILDSFNDAEFWYVDQGIRASEADRSCSFNKIVQRQDEKWWLPVPRVPPGGLSENSRKELLHKRECTSQMFKAAMAINGDALAEMEVPDSFLESLPKSGRACLGDVIYRYITSHQFSSECLLDCLDLSSEHAALEIANCVEAAIYVWRRRIHSKPPINPNRSTARSSWDMVKELMIDGDKRELLAERAESLLLCLKQRFPSLTQTTLDTSKIHYNKDVGKSILESYSRVLESLAFNTMARIDDLLYVDDMSKLSEKVSSIPKVSIIAHKKAGSVPFPVPVQSTSYKTSSRTPAFSPASLISPPAKGERTPFPKGNKNERRGFGVKRVLANYLGVDSRPKCTICPSDGSVSNPIEAPASQNSVGGFKC